MAIKNDKQHQALKDEEMSKQHAARIATAPDASKYVGEQSHSGSEPPAGSGTVTGDSPEKRQAGSYSRDAEQDPEEAPASDRDDVPEDDGKSRPGS
jgi:hypothetical protein